MNTKPAIDLAASQSGVLARFGWKYSMPRKEKTTDLGNFLQQCHRANNLGFRVAEMTLDGVPVDEAALLKFNLWVSAGGAWRVSLLPYWEMREFVEAVVRGKVGLPQVGQGGGGRLTRAKAEKNTKTKIVISPGRVGRPPLSGVAMTRAQHVERQRNDRKRLKFLKGRTGPEEASKMMEFDRALGL